MATVNVTDIAQSEDKYLKRSKTATVSSTGDVFVYPALQTYAKITNGGSRDLKLDIGGFTNEILHPGQVFENNVEFRQFNIYGVGGTCDMTVVTKEKDTKIVDDARLFEILKLREALGSDLKIVAAAAGSSAATVNAAIAGASAKFTRTVSIEIQNTAGTKNTGFNGSIPISVAKVSTNGVIAIAGGITYVTFVAGAASVVLEYTGTWAAGNTATLTIGPGERYGYALAAGTSVDTLIA
jgi:hypothetical protein